MTSPTGTCESRSANMRASIDICLMVMDHLCVALSGAEKSSDAQRRAAWRSDVPGRDEPEHVALRREAQRRGALCSGATSCEIHCAFRTSQETTSKRP